MAGTSLAHDITPLAAAAAEAKSVLICIHPQSTYDAVSAALAWKLSWEQAGKAVSVVCSAPMRAEYSRLQAVEAVTSEIGNRDLVVAFPYDDNIVDKVSYNVNEEKGMFELIISPKNGFSPLSPSSIQYRQAGLSAEVVVLFGFHGFAELGEIYEKEKFAFDSAFTVAVTQTKIPNFAKFHIALQPEHLSYSEWVYFVLRQLNIGALNERSATNLLQGVEYATDRFVMIQNPRTFETVASLLRLNAHRQPDNPAFAQLSTPIAEQSNSEWGASMKSSVPAFEGEYITSPRPAPASFVEGQVVEEPKFAETRKPATQPRQNHNTQTSRSNHQPNQPRAGRHSGQPQTDRQGNEVKQLVRQQRNKPVTPSEFAGAMGASK